VADPQSLRQLPSVHDVVERVSSSVPRIPRALITSEVRRALDDMRHEIAAGQPPEPSVADRALAALAALERPSLRRVINATGVVLHTNLGRSPLGPAAILPGYSNLEYDLAAGRRGKRDTHIAALLQKLLAAPGIAVNNNAAAVFLALHELAAGGEVVISRGELIEIGDGFRIPEIMSRSGAILREVGTTNRTTAADYRAAVNEHTRLLLRVHPSNFRISGFTARPDLPELAAIAREHNVPLYEDLGSGCLTDLRPFGIEEPVVSESLSAGVDLVSFSGDKLLGGPQAGILAGKPEIVARLRRNPLFRALRLDKVICQLLENTLRNVLLEHWDSIPAIAMIRQPAAQIRVRAESLLDQIPSTLQAALEQGRSVIGGGATPEQSLPTWLVVLRGSHINQLESRLRNGDPPVIARIEDDRLVIDLRTVSPDEQEELAAALSRATQHATTPTAE
jgi:L-seryl-tRNA(Ser) seleniumtransferase